MTNIQYLRILQSVGYEQVYVKSFKQTINLPEQFGKAITINISYKPDELHACAKRREKKRKNKRLNKIYG